MSRVTSNPRALRTRRGRVLVVALTVLAAALLAFAPTAGADRSVVGQLVFPRGSGAGQVGAGIAVGGVGGIAVNAANGNVYAVDQFNNRIDQFSAPGDFIRAFGADVVASGPGQSNATQSVAVDATGGDFTLSFGGDSTADLPHDTPPSGGVGPTASLENALNALPSISAGGGSVSVSGGPGGPGAATPYLVRFDGGPLAGAAQPLLSAASGSPPLSGGASIVTVATTNPGATGFEVCEEAGGGVCKAGLGPFGVGGIGGALGDPVGIAIDQASGDLYVTNTAASRVEEFSASGQFRRAWGRDVVFSGPDDSAVDEQQKVTLGANTTGGTFTLTFANRATVPIPFNAPASGGVNPGDSVQNALDALATIGGLPTPGSVSVSGPSGGPYTIEFGGSLAGDNVGQISSDASNLTVSSGTGSAAVATLADGGGFEVCVPGDVCKSGAGGTGAGAVNPSAFFRGGVAVAPPGAGNAGDVIVADNGNDRVQEFTAAGAFVRAFGFDVDATNPSTGFEVCTAVSGHTCQAGTSGSGVGQFSGTAPKPLSEDSSGAIYAASGRGVQKFTPPDPYDPSVLTPSLFGASETQALTVNTGAGQFKLSFDANPNGTKGTGSLTQGSNVITNVATVTGQFTVGQQLRDTSGGLTCFTGNGDVLITAVDAANHTVTVSQLCSATKPSAAISSGLPYTTGNLPFNASASQIAAALNALPSIGGIGGSVSVSGGVGDPGGNNPYSISFDGGTLARTDPAQITASQGTTPLSGGSGPGADTAGVATTTPGGPWGSDANNGTDLPVGLAIGSGGAVLIAKNYPPNHDPCPAGFVSPTEVRIQALSSAGAVEETSMPCAGIRSGTALAADPVSGSAFLASSFGTFPNQYAYVFNDPGPPPTIALDSPSNLTATGVKVSGTINPNGPGPASYPNVSTTTYRVEYKKSSDSDWKVFSSDLPVGSGASPVPFGVGVSGLQPNTPYDIRVAAVKPFGFAPVYGTQTITTLPAAPAIGSFSASNVTADSADLHALINPLGSDTTYHFEYGVTLSYGHKTPETDIGSSLSPQAVSFHIDNLDPVVYHFRVVAHNVKGDTASTDQTFNFYPEPCPNSAVRQQTGSGSLPDCRAYELASPADAGSAFLNPGGPTSAAATNPPRLGFTGALGSVPGPWNPPTLLFGDDDEYVATRTDSGWQTHFVGFPANVTTAGHDSPFSGLGVPGNVGLPSDRSMSRFLQWTDNSMDPYVFDSQGNELDHWPTNLVDFPAAGQGGLAGTEQPSPDFSHLFYSSANVALAPGGLTSGAGSLYDDDTKAGTVTIASKLPGGGDIPAEPGANNQGKYLRIARPPLGSAVRPSAPAISTNGSHVLIGAPAGCGAGAFSACPLTHLYMRVNGAVTYDVSEGHDVSFEGMTDSGSVVYFTTDQAIPGTGDTDSSIDLYMWKESDDSVTRVSAGTSPGIGDTDACSASWIAKCGVAVVPSSGGGFNLPENTTIGPATDNSTAGVNGDIYFYSPEQFVGSNGIPGRRNLYVYHDGGIEYVATLDADKPISRIQVSPDGSFSAFITASRLTGYDNTTDNPLGICSPAGIGQPATGPQCTEMYRFNANSGDLICVSCLPSGDPPPGDVQASRDGIFMSDDGRTFFQADYPIVPADTNDDTDVYEYEGGRAQLISSGTGVGTYVPSFGQKFQYQGLVGVSADGADVYFTTPDRLVSGDRNNDAFLKFYDARTNGGFPVAAQVAPCQAADECHGVGNSAPQAPQFASGADLGSGGNLSPPSGRKHKVHKHHRKHKRRHHRKQGRQAGRAAG